MIIYVKGYFTIKKGDTLPSLRVTLQSGNEPVDLTDATVYFVMVDSKNSEVVNQPAHIVDAEEGIVEYYWRPEDTKDRGSYYAEFRVHFAADENHQATFPNDGHIEVKVL